MKINRVLVTAFAVLICGTAIIAVLHFRRPHRIAPAGAALPYHVVHDENFYNISVSMSDRVPRGEWCVILSKAATDLDNSARDYMWKDSIYIDAYLETRAGLSTAPVATFKRYVPIKNHDRPWWIRWIEFPKDDKCTLKRNS